MSIETLFFHDQNIGSKNRNFPASYFTPDISTLAKLDRHYTKAYCISINYNVRHQTLSSSQEYGVFLTGSFIIPMNIFLVTFVGRQQYHRKMEHIQIALNKLTKVDFITTYKYFFHDLYCSLEIISYCNNSVDIELVLCKRNS